MKEIQAPSGYEYSWNRWFFSGDEIDFRNVNRAIEEGYNPACANRHPELFDEKYLIDNNIKIIDGTIWRSSGLLCERKSFDLYFEESGKNPEDTDLIPLDSLRRKDQFVMIL